MASKKKSDGGQQAPSEKKPAAPPGPPVPSFDTSPLKSPFATTRQNPTTSGPGNPLGDVVPPTDDIAFQPPTDPLKTSTRASIIYRTIPVGTIQTNWDVPSTTQALQDLASGKFDKPAQLAESIIADSRIQATLGSLIGGLFSKGFKFKIPPRYKDDPEAQKCLRNWKRMWRETAMESALAEYESWAVIMGFAVGTLWWDTAPQIWRPYLHTFHPRNLYYNESQLRKYVAQTMDGQVAVQPGNGTWVLHSPHGERGWMHGAIRAVAEPWLILRFAYRDFARKSERDGFPIILAKTPAAGAPDEIQQFRAALSTLGQESIVQIPQGVDKEFGYGLEYLEVKSDAWQIFDSLISRCEMSITLAIAFQNLTTEVKEGSLAAARQHGDIRQSALEFRARALASTVHTQIARPFAAFNHKNPDYAPICELDVTPSEDSETTAKTLSVFADAIHKLGQSGIGVADIGKLARAFNIPLDEAGILNITPLNSGGLGG